MSLISKLQKLFASNQLSVYFAVKLKNQCREVISHHIGKNNCIKENGEGWFLKRYLSGTNGQIFDVGANEGEWSMAAREFSSGENEIHCYEPDPRAAKNLRERTKNMSSINVTESAVGEEVGRVKFYTSKESTELSTVNPIKRRNYESGKVSMTTIDEEVYSNGVENVSLLKIDVEGYESEVIKGASESLKKGLVDCIQFEYGEGWLEAGNTLTNVIMFLSRMGFEIFMLQKSSLKKNHIEFFGEYFSYTNYIAIKKEKVGKIRNMLEND